MSVELLKRLSTISFVIAVGLLLVAVLLFFVLKIPQVYGDLSHRTQRKAIADIQQMNEKSTGKIANNVSMKNIGKTDRISASGTLLSHTSELITAPNTEKIQNETTLLTQDITDMYEYESVSSETTLLSEEMLGVKPVGIEKEIVFMESLEIIE